jgi:hypothetical protein
MTQLDDHLLTSLQAARPDPGYQPSADSPVATAMLARILQTGRDPAPRGSRRRLLPAVLQGAISAPGRARRRIPALAGGLTAAAAAAAAAAAVVLTSGPGAVPGQQATAGHARTVVTAAWTVREDADGTVTITMRQYANPAGLQQTLRADGVNAIVRRMPSQTFLRPLPGSRKPRISNCSYATTNDAPPAVQRAVVTIVQSTRDLPGLRGFVIRAETFIIHPDAMPQGSALFLPFATNEIAPPTNGYPAVKARNPVVLNNDTVPACVPVT